MTGHDLPDAKPVRLRIWDAPTRLFHWTLVLLIAAAWWTAEERMLDWHRLAGYCIAALLLFRLIWGLVGSETARFSSFVHGPMAVAAYARGRRALSPGHNPLGGWSVIALLGLLCIQLVLGTLAVDVDGIESGPFSYLVDFDTGRAAAEWHELIFNILLGFIALHVAAVFFYLFFRRENLIGAMISGSRKWTGDPPVIRFAPLPLAFAVMLSCALLVWIIISWWGRA
ncbi:cytochrome b/b6 domain-containing protein [Sphingobium sp. DC-2]|uniref:cytochrome b/b6 domain-containing protein n=1 Tax=Sphingobium sp. DC-2 TaxID=1303256 RepID=UPI0004C37C60|nr:cytochrome b/b6 domain-containing protein [Sphingobium sp. DC-2]